MEKKIPFLGICFGAQLFYVAFCRKYLGLEGANSTEIDPKTPYPVVDLLEEQKAVTEKGGTMRLGGLKIVINENTRLFDAYKQKEIVERFRHRYHIQERYITDLLAKTNMLYYKRAPTPMVSSTILSKSLGKFFKNKALYRFIIKYLYYAIMSRLEISYAVNKLS